VLLLLLLLVRWALGWLLSCRRGSRLHFRIRHLRLWWFDGLRVSAGLRWSSGWPTYDDGRAVVYTLSFFLLEG